MKTKFMAETAFSRAYSAWFDRYDAERRRRHRRPGATLADFPAAPTHPDDLAALVARIGRRRVLDVLEISRTTLDRWQTGATVPPRSAVLLLVVMADGRLPGMSADWSAFRFDGDALTIPGTRWRYTARQLAGLPMLDAHARAIAAENADLKSKIAHLLRVGDFQAANDAVTA